jgi:hypothetical protein
MMNETPDKGASVVLGQARIQEKRLLDTGLHQYDDSPDTCVTLIMFHSPHPPFIHHSSFIHHPSSIIHDSSFIFIIHH